MNTLQTIDAETLMTTFLSPTRFVVERLLPQGLHVLAGAPKVGKSWLALWLCLCVAKGEPVWGFETKQGGVLYLCLEDSYVRVQNRMFQITDSAPHTLHFANLADSRDIEYMELSLCFQKEQRCWELAQPVKKEQVSVDPELVFLSEFLKQLKTFDGTATELSVLLEEHTGEKLLPSVLSKRLVRYAAELDKTGIRIASSRTRDSRQLHILCVNVICKNEYLKSISNHCGQRDLIGLPLPIN